MSKVDLDLIQKYDVKGPRYTSYPTALQFHPLNEGEYQKAVSTSHRAGGPLSLYVHIPFCRHLCYYCACSKIVTRDKSKATRYLSFLKREIEMQAPLFAGRKVTQLHWGGGTPTFLDDDQIQDLMQFIGSHFDLADDATGEFGIEIDPRTVDAERLACIREVGFNRLSFGVQDFAPKVQKAVNRVQSFESTRDIVEAARKLGFQSVSIDLIYGLPFQTRETMVDTLRQVIVLSPDRISLYNYAHLPERFTPQKRINVIDLPRADEKLSILALAIEQLTTVGYRYIGMDHFAKPDDELARAQSAGNLHRNFQGYSTHADCDMVALGVTAISQVGEIYAQNAKDLDEYEALIDDGRLAIIKGVEIDADDQRRRAIIMALICQFELDFAEFAERFGADIRDCYAAEIAALEPMMRDELVQIDDSGIRVTDKGRLLVRNVCMVFDRYLGEVQTSRYSKAI